jgi:hypothetical protein
VEVGVGFFAGVVGLIVLDENAALRSPKSMRSEASLDAGEIAGDNEGDGIGFGLGKVEVGVGVIGDVNGVEVAGLGGWGFLGLGAGLDGDVYSTGLVAPTERPEKSWLAKVACFSFNFGWGGWAGVGAGLRDNEVLNTGVELAGFAFVAAGVVVLFPTNPSRVQPALGTFSCRVVAGVISGVTWGEGGVEASGVGTGDGTTGDGAGVEMGRGRVGAG